MNERKSRFKLRWWERTYLINPEIQLRYAVSGVVMGLFSSFVSALLILWTFAAFNIWQGQRLPKPVLVVIALVLFVNAAGIYISIVMMTHKIVGPIYSLVRFFQKVREGDLSVEVRFRQGDEIHFVASEFNQTMMYLRNQEEQRKKDFQQLLDTLNKGNVAGAQAKVTELLAASEAIKKE